MTDIVIPRAGDIATHYDDSYKAGVVTRFTTVGVFLTIDGEEVGPFSRTDYTYSRPSVSTETDLRIAQLREEVEAEMRQYIASGRHYPRMWDLNLLLDTLDESGRAVEELVDAYQAHYRAGREMHAALLDIWRMVEPDDTEHMTYRAPSDVFESVRTVLTPRTRQEPVAVSGVQSFTSALNDDVTFLRGELAGYEACLGLSHRREDKFKEQRDEARASLAERDAKIKSITTLLSELTDPDDCWFDHHGGCQAHGFISLNPGETCPHADAKALIAAQKTEADNEETS